ncbi:MAG: DUF4912 domain-containing protein [Verrucomicrobiota bacterium]
MRPDRRRWTHKVAPTQKEDTSAGKQARFGGAQLSQTKAEGKKKPVTIPALLLEDDTATTLAPTGPGGPYALEGPAYTPPLQPVEQSGELPEAYGTQRLFLIARDPHWLYAHWDLTREHLRQYNALSADRHLVLRVYVNSVSEQPLTEIHVHPESRNWFVYVEHGGAKYLAELGYYERNSRKWITISKSKATLTPADTLSPDTTARFATIPFEDSLQKLTETANASVGTRVLLTEAIKQPYVSDDPQRATATFPPTQSVPAAEEAGVPTGESSPDTTARFAVTPSEASIEEFVGIIKAFVGTNIPVEALEELPVSDSPRPAHNSPVPGDSSAPHEEDFGQLAAGDRAPRAGVEPSEVTELVWRKLIAKILPAAAAEFSFPTSPPSAFSNVSSPVPIAERKTDFWFNVNAELVVYGATEPDASVTIGGRMIKLRPDGSFSYRFALPDGAYELPVAAVSANQIDGRAAELSFQRRTEYRGNVSAHPEDPSLSAPASAPHVA